MTGAETFTDRNSLGRKATRSYSTLSIEAALSLETQNWSRAAYHRDVVVINAARPYLTESKLRFCTESNPVRGVSEVCISENFSNSHWAFTQLTFACSKSTIETLKKSVKYTHS